MNITLRLILAGLLIVATTAGALAIPVAVTGADLIDYRDTDNGLVGQGRWDPSQGGFRIDWDIQDMGSYWSYTYQLSNQDGSILSPDLSHWILEVSPSITPANIDEVIFNLSVDFSREDGVAELDWDQDPDGTTGSGPGGNNGNPNLPADLHGMKFPGEEESLLIYSFDSTRMPIWGSMYAKDGSGYRGSPATTVWNAAIGTMPTELTSDFSGWIPVPDTGKEGPPGEVIPEPGTISLLGVALMGSLAWRRRRRR